MSSAPNAPTPAASLGEKTPRYSPPMTTEKSRTMLHTRVRERSLSFRGALCPAGPSAGLRFTQKRTTAMYRAIWIRPGIKPAMNMSPMDCPVMIPYSTMTVLGGMRMPSVPPAAMQPVARVLA